MGKYCVSPVKLCDDLMKCRLVLLTVLIVDSKVLKQVFFENRMEEQLNFTCIDAEMQKKKWNKK